MIRIKRVDPPAALAGRAHTRYNRPGVVEALYKMQYEKCCYCEEKIPTSGVGKAVEHFHPRAGFGELKHEWNNLLLVCATCNSQKSDQFPMESVPQMLSQSANQEKIAWYKPGVTPLLIDPANPSDADPEDHLEVLVDESIMDGMLVSLNGSQRGAAMLEVIGLQKAFHMKRHRRHMCNLRMAYHQMLVAFDDRDLASAEVQHSFLVQAMRPHARFSGVARSYYRQKKIGERFAYCVAQLG